MEAEDGLTAEFMHQLLRDGVIGYKEFRAWLANNFVSYNEVKDHTIDAMIDTVARERFERQRYPEEPEDDTTLPGAA